MFRAIFTGLMLATALMAADDPLKDKGRPVATTAAMAPEETARQFVVPAGFRVELVAGEPRIVQPVAFTTDDRGRIWIVENTNYPESPGQPRDRLLVLEDADGDGRYEKSTLFATNLTFTTGLAVGFGGVWLGAPPHLLFVPDADGDAQPDGPPQVLLDGWAAEDTHETLNGFTWGPDGWLYGTHGVFTHSLVGKPGAPAGQRIRIDAAVWRYHPVRHVFERWCEGGSNQWGIDWNDRGEACFEACVIPHLWHAIQGARYQRQGGVHENPHTYEDLRTIAWGRYEKAAYCGAMFYLADAFPAEWRDRFFFFDIHMNKLRCETLERDGSGYRSKRQPELLYSPDAWFRGLSPQLAPDGSVLFNDWYDKVPCHQQRAFTDRGNGRLYRIANDATKPVRVDLTKATDLELVEMQLHPNDWYVRHARRLLQERGPKPETTAKLADLLAHHSNETRRLRALWILHSQGALTEAAALEASRDPSEYVRGWAVTCLAEPGRVSETVATRLAEIANDPAPLVRLRVASALQRLAPAERWPALERLVAQAGNAADRNLPLMTWYALEPALADDPVRGAGLLPAIAIPTVRTFAARRLVALAATGHEAALRSLDRFAETLAAAPGATRSDLLRGALAACAGNVELREPAGWVEAYRKLRVDEDGDVRRDARALAVVFRSPVALQELRDLLGDESAGQRERRQALQTLGARRDAGALDGLLALARATNALQAEALSALAAYDDERIAAISIAAGGSTDVTVKRAALMTLASRSAWAQAWLGAIDAGRLPRASIDAPLAQTLRGLGDPAVDAWLEKNWGSVRTSNEETRKEIERYRKFLGEDAILRASVTNGRAVFQRTCFVCHTLFGQGGQIGPELPGRFNDVDYLLQNILDPNAIIGRDFQQTFVKKLDGSVVTGVVTAEDERILTLRTLAGPMTVERAGIASREVSPLSMMPAGLLKTLTEQEVRDLFLYLRQSSDTP